MISEGLHDRRIMIITWLTNGWFAKFCFGYFFAITLAVPLERTQTDWEFTQDIIQSLPSQLGVLIGVLWMVAKLSLVVIKAHDEYLMRKIKLQEEREKLKQAEIDTDIKREELE